MFPNCESPNEQMWSNIPLQILPLQAPGHHCRTEEDYIHMHVYAIYNSYAIYMWIYPEWCKTLSGVIICNFPDNLILIGMFWFFKQSKTSFPFHLKQGKTPIFSFFRIFSETHIHTWILSPWFHPVGKQGVDGFPLHLPITYSTGSKHAKSGHPAYLWNQEWLICSPPDVSGLQLPSPLLISHVDWGQWELECSNLCRATSETVLWSNLLRLEKP